MPNATPGSVIAFADAPPAPVVVLPGFWGRAGRLLREEPASTAALAFLGLLSLVALLAPFVMPYSPIDQLDIIGLRTQPPSVQHWFGTDGYSRDVLSRVIDGARVSLSIAFLAASLASLVGTLYGAIAGYLGGALDTLMMRVVDAVLAIPRILLLLFVVAWWNGLSVPALVVLFSLTGWFGVSRLVRADVLQLRQREFIAAARALGATPWRIIVRHVVPHVLAPVFVAATLAVGNIIVVEAGLAYLGRGVPPPRASWGSIILDGHDVLASGWWISLFPGLALVLTVLAVNVVADRLREALSPRQRPAV